MSTDRGNKIRVVEPDDRYRVRLDDPDECFPDGAATCVTFRDVALDYLEWLGDANGAKPSTLRAVRSGLAEPGIAYRRGTGETQGRIMKARALICAIFNYGMCPGTWGLIDNPATWADRRRELLRSPSPITASSRSSPSRE